MVLFLLLQITTVSAKSMEGAREAKQERRDRALRIIQSSAGKRVKIVPTVSAQLPIFACALRGGLELVAMKYEDEE